MHRESPITDHNLATELLKRVPEFLPHFKRHLEQHEGVVLIHSLLYDLVRFSMEVGEDILRGESPSVPEQEQLLVRIASFVEACAESTDPAVINAVRVSFLEELIEPEAASEPLIALLGDGSRTLLKQQESYLEELAEIDKRMRDC